MLRPRRLACRGHASAAASLAGGRRHPPAAHAGPRNHLRGARMSATLGSTVKDFRDTREQAGSASLLILRIDPLLMLAAVALVACSVYVVGGATKDDIAGNPHYYFYRQIA